MSDVGAFIVDGTSSVERWHKFHDSPNNVGLEDHSLNFGPRVGQKIVIDNRFGSENVSTTPPRPS